jgi:MEMO1 family protein
MDPEVRPAAVAGSFYPELARQLRADVDAYLHGAEPPSGPPPKALIVPHAGYRYSGPIAASAYARLAPFADRYARVVLLGPSHRLYFLGLALPQASAFETPLGVVPVDVEALAKIPHVPRIAAAHDREHALEVQLPFGTFAIVPLVVGDARGAEVAKVIEALWGGPETLFVISSDLSHYLPYAEAQRVDEETARRIERLSDAPILHEEACGATPVNGMLIAAKRRGLRVARLDVRNSGDTAGSRSEVVGYGAFALFEEA